MRERSCAFRIGVHVLAATVAATSGCARPLPPPSSYATNSGEVHANGFSAVPHIVADGEPMKFVGLSPAQREAFEKHRQTFEEDRQQRIGQLKTANLGSRNTPEAMTLECVIRTLIIFSPLCIVIVPLALGLAHTVEGTKAANRVGYLPSLPSDQELLRVGEVIKQRLSADALARRLSGDLQLAGEPRNDNDRFPRLVIRLESATFTPDRLITISVVGKAQPAAGVVWPPTEHRYHLGYSGDGEPLVRGLADAEASLARSILSTYSLKAGPAAVSPPR